MIKHLIKAGIQQANNLVDSKLALLTAVQQRPLVVPGARAVLAVTATARATIRLRSVWLALSKDFMLSAVG